MSAAAYGHARRPMRAPISKVIGGQASTPRSTARVRRHPVEVSQLVSCVIVQEDSTHTTHFRTADFPLPAAASRLNPNMDAVPLTPAVSTRKTSESILYLSR